MNKSLLPLLVFAATLLAYAYRGISYALIGSYAPFLVLAGVLVLLLVGWLAGRGVFLWVVRLWGAFLCLLGIARLAMVGIILIDPGISAHAADVFAPLAVLPSLVYLAAGIYLIVQARRILPPPPTA